MLAIEFKDLVSLLLSSAALLLSIYATWRSWQTKHSEERRIVRAELSNTVAKFLENDIENAKLWREFGQTNRPFVDQISSMLNTRNVQLLYYAKNLMSTIPDLVSASDHVAIANASWNTFDLLSAEEHFEAALLKSGSEVERVSILRGHAMILFRRGRFLEGRDLFDKAIRAITTNDDLAHFTNGFTYQSWGAQERDIAGDERQATIRFEEAGREYTRIDAQTARSSALDGLAGVRGGEQLPPQALAVTQ